jgi:hypothetical protein
MFIQNPTQVRFNDPCTSHIHSPSVIKKVAPLSYNIIIIIIISMIIIISGSAAQRGLWPPRSRGFMITHNEAPQSVGLLWTSDQLAVETST